MIDLPLLDDDYREAFLYLLDEIDGSGRVLMSMIVRLAKDLIQEIH